tara:strand:+ start:394 stop:621 length:228 start_codon:yes stop_codon:yes gene_type:complete
MYAFSNKMSEQDTINDVSISVEDRQITEEEAPNTTFDTLYKEVLSTIHKNSLDVSDLVPLVTKGTGTITTSIIWK